MHPNIVRLNAATFDVCSQRNALPEISMSYASYHVTREPPLCRGSPANKQGTLFNICQDVTSRAAYKYNINSMVSLYVSTSFIC